MRLIIAEKPSVAKSISRITGAAEKKDGYMEGNGCLVTWCIGHLVEPAPPESYGEQWKKWDYGSLPVIPEEWRYAVAAGKEKQFNTIKELMHRPDVSEIINACDAGREGELIFRLVYETAGCGKPVKRLWISSMEESAIREGFENLRPGSDYDSLYHSALCRQKADWIVGINGTRLFTVLYGRRVMKVGRVQTPTLAMLADREAEIMGFRKEAYFTAHILMDGINVATGRIDGKKKADEIAGACRNGKALVTSVLKEEKSAMPPKLYDLTTLQRDANRLFGFTAKQTLECAQSLYEKKLATYPRTDSRFLTDDMEDTARGVIEAIRKTVFPDAASGAEPDIKKVLDSGRVTDHHAIIPTVEVADTGLAELPETERKILYMTAARLLCATGEKHLYESVKAEFSCGGHTFAASGKTITHNGWKDFEDAFVRLFKISAGREEEKEEKKLPELSEGQEFYGVQAAVTVHSTQPPKRYTEDSLLSAMERAGAEEMGGGVERTENPCRHGLGTPATRADIIEKLVKDGYAKREKRNIVATEEGMKLIAALPGVVKSTKLTADWENALALVAKGELAMEGFMGGIEKMMAGLVKSCHGAARERKFMS